MTIDGLAPRPGRAFAAPGLAEGVRPPHISRDNMVLRSEPGLRMPGGVGPVAADGKGITVHLRGSPLGDTRPTFPWPVMSPGRFCNIARKCADDHGALEAYCRGMGLTKEAEEEERLAR